MGVGVGVGVWGAADVTLRGKWEKNMMRAAATQSALQITRCIMGARQLLM